MTASLEGRVALVTGAFPPAFLDRTAGLGDVRADDEEDLAVYVHRIGHSARPRVLHYQVLLKKPKVYLLGVAVRPMM